MPAVVPSEPKARFIPRVVVVIPVYKHCGLLVEAIESVLAQQATFDIACVVVDDGCPFPETGEIGRTYALAHRNVFYVRKPNGGLSSARNHGIEFAQRNFPDFEALYLLDADNRITPNALAVLMDFLAKRPDIDWVYPNIDKFGIAWSGNYTTEYSRLLHLTFDNICEAGSLISRRLVQSGIRFDETMKSGFEDWDFWLQALGKGFIGANHPFFGFEYRQRAESMLRDSNRTRDTLLSYLRQKHKALFEPDALLSFEHDEAPRYAMIGVGTYVVSAFTDPEQAHETYALDEFVRRFWAARNEPDTYGTPPFLLWMSEAERNALSRLRLLHNVLWLAERLSERHNFVAIRFETVATKMEVDIRPIDKDYALGKKLAGWAAKNTIVTDCAEDATDEWIRSLRNQRPKPSVVELVVRAPFTAAEVQGTMLSPTNALLATIGALRDSGFRAQAGQKWIWRQPYLPKRSEYYQLLRRALGTHAVMPRMKSAANPLRVGMLLPIASFGGVEKVAFAMAHVLKAHGCEVHLFVLGKPLYERHTENDGLFASINFLAADYPLWGGPHDFAGHELLMEGDHGAIAQDVLGFLSGLDVVINNQVAPVNSVLGSLRRQGVRVLNYVHVLDRNPSGREAGHPYLTLGFEHVYDTILTCSRDMNSWMHGMGVPAAKLVHIANAPSYALSEADRNKALAVRRRQPAERPLKALFLGRFDTQKGIERLYATIRELKRRGSTTDWRIVGKDVVESGVKINWQARFKEIATTVVPPLYDAADLTRAFTWADIVVLPSRWEGAPLTIIEAQRLGCVPVASAVGAVEELIAHGEDGLVVRGDHDGKIIEGFVAEISRLEQDRAALAALSEGGVKRAASASWEKSAEPLLDILAGWFPGRIAANGKTGTRLIQIRSQGRRKAAGGTVVDGKAEDVA